MSKPRYRLAPPHGDRIYWQGPRVDSRVEEISADRAWFWRGMERGVTDGHHEDR